MKTAETSIKFLFIIAACISFQSLAAAKIETVLGNVALKDNLNIALNIPTTELPEIILSRDQYLLSYNKFRCR